MIDNITPPQNSSKQLKKQSISLKSKTIDQLTDKAEDLLSDPKNGIYQLAGRIVHIVKIPSCVGASQSSLAIRDADSLKLADTLTKEADWIKFDNRLRKNVKTDCPEKISKYLIARGEWKKIPSLSGIVNAPTLRRDGTIVNQQGYDKDSGLLFTSDHIFSSVPENPSKEEAKEAANKLLFLLKDFPFENEASRSVVISAILTALVRRSIATAPIHGFSAPKMASGKSLLSNIPSLIATGKPISVISYANDENEEQKRLFALLRDGDLIICYDNVEAPLSSAALCTILTSPETYKGRILGKSDNATVPTTALFLANGNNLEFSGDLSTRAILCSLDPQVERPEEREFDINIYSYISENRDELVQAALTILRAYIVAGKPKQNLSQFGRFEEWSDLIRSAIVWIDLADPYETRRNIENADPIRIILKNLFEEWYNCFQEKPIQVKELISKSKGNESLRNCLLEIASDRIEEQVNQRSLGKKLSSYKNRIENGYRLENCGQYKGQNQWRLKKVS